MSDGGLKQALSELAEEFQTRLVRTARIDKTNATGRFVNSFDVKSTEDSIEVTNDVMYANAIIDGLKKGKSRPPKDNILRWAKAKGIRPYRRLKGGGTKFARTNTEKRSALNAMTYLIYKSIKEKGTIKRFNYKGSSLIDRVYKEMEGKFKVEITEAYKEDLKTEIKRILKVD